jgi:hypothetical protein
VRGSWNKMKDIEDAGVEQIPCKTSQDIVPGADR